MRHELTGGLTTDAPTPRVDDAADARANVQVDTQADARANTADR